ncbi:MAG: hypothetical protein RBU37_24920, partial [Myxococcota bacterium]|nr:hypothetical protein [Myxococcota bacterium]
MSEQKHEAAFVHDLVEGFNPISFAIELTRRMRRDSRVQHPPSLRSSLAIPRFLSARYFRTHRLSPLDYVAAAVLNTTPEDQAIAEQVARELLFPKPSDQGDARGGAPERDAAPAAPPAPIDDPT